MSYYRDVPHKFAMNEVKLGRSELGLTTTLDNVGNIDEGWQPGSLSWEREGARCLYEHQLHPITFKHKLNLERVCFSTAVTAC
jgi:hypothetical protein